MKSSADVVIAGGGCMGCSVAWHLAQLGITDVVLLEREPQLGAGSTGKNAGGFRHQFSNSANIELSIESIALMKDFERIVGTPIDFHQDGYLFLLSKSSNIETFKRNVALQQKHGVDVPVEPERRHIFIASPPGGGSWDDQRHAGRVAKSKILVIDFESTFYFHREGGGLLFGMGDPDERPGFDTTVRWDFLPKVIEVAIQRLPALSDAAVSHAWAGLYEMTPDHNPIIGPSSDVDGFYTIAGFSGHGFQHSPAAGRILADVIAGRDPKFDLAPFELDRFARKSMAGEANVV